MLKKYFSKIDYGLIISIVAIISFGLLGLYSASHGAFSSQNEFSKQLTWVAVGGVFFLLFSLIDYKFLKHLSIPSYIAIILLLLFVFLSPQNNGATSWFKVGNMSMQPAEFSKIAIIILLARLIGNYENKEDLNKLYHIIIMLIIVAIPVALIMMQPDYGTAMVIIFFSAVMLFIAGIDIRYIIIALILLLLLVPTIYMLLPEHAKVRIDTFLDPNKDPNGAGYNVIQSELAVGAGMLSGMGFQNGNQTQLGTIPMKTTDFIFSVISEEFGFVGDILIIVLYAILLFRLIHISRVSKDVFGQMICIGTFAMFLFHIIENIGMSIGLLPITGIPLPLISYGGSSMLTNMILLGMSESVSIHRKTHLF